MLVIADTGPINYLLLVGEIQLLEFLFGQVLLPIEVQEELLALGAPEIVRIWAAHLPPWCTVVRDPSPPLSQLGDLHPGERAAIELAVHIQAERVLLDDLEARHLAATLSIKVQGTLGILKEAARAGQIDLHDVVARLLQTNFTASQKLIEGVLNTE